MELITIEAACQKHGIPGQEKRLRGTLWTENNTGKLELPIGDWEKGLVYDDWRLEKWAQQFKS